DAPPRQALADAAPADLPGCAARRAALLVAQGRQERLLRARDLCACRGRAAACAACEVVARPGAPHSARHRAGHSAGPNTAAPLAVRHFGRHKAGTNDFSEPASSALVVAALLLARLVKSSRVPAPGAAPGTAPGTAPGRTPPRR